jgi:glycosyltransferase involved in cell wall biosynthesis
MADRPLSITVVVGPTSGGIGRHVHAVVQQLVEMEQRVCVVAPDATDALFDWRSTGATLVTAPVGAASPGALMRARRAVRLATTDADVSHAHGVRAGAVSALAGVHPLVVTWHNTRPVRWSRRLGHPLAERLAARGADLTLAVSRDLLGRAAAAGATDMKVVAAPAPPLPLPKRSPGEVRSALGVAGRPPVLAVARLEAQKRLDLLVEATAGWRDRPDRPAVVLAGTGRLAGDLERRARQLRSPVILVGRRDDVPDLIRASDVVVLPSDWEGYPLVAQESLRLGTPLLATAVGGVPDLVGEAARLVPPDNASALRAALDDLIADADERARLADAGVRRAAMWPTLPATVDELLTDYRNLMFR